MQYPRFLTEEEQEEVKRNRQIEREIQGYSCEAMDRMQKKQSSWKRRKYEK